MILLRANTRPTRTARLTEPGTARILCAQAHAITFGRTCKVKKAKAAHRYDHTFKAIHDREVEWESDDVRGLLKLPPGVKVKVLNFDPAMKRIDMKLRFPAGYVEPAHTHDSWHSILVTKGRMCVAGKDLRPGDYVFGWDIRHGPYEYPDGCEVFVVNMGDAAHVWDAAQLLAHKNAWKPKTAAGRKGVLTHRRKRAAGKI
jgi:hypothetical protein